MLLFCSVMKGVMSRCLSVLMAVIRCQLSFALAPNVFNKMNPWTVRGTVPFSTRQIASLSQVKNEQSKNINHEPTAITIYVEMSQLQRPWNN